MNDMHETALLDHAITALRGAGLDVLALKPPRGANARRADRWLRIGKGGQATDYRVEAKRGVTPRTLGAIVAQLRDLAKAGNRPALLVADYVTPPVAEQLRAHRQQFVDVAGNAYLEGPGILVYMIGRKPNDLRAAPTADRVFTINGLKILFALICDPALAAMPQRGIATAAGVALGAVPGVLHDLQTAGHLLVIGRNRRLNATKRLLDEWAFAYARKLRPKTLIATYSTPNFDAWQQWQVDPGEVRWGGEPAAQLLVRHLRPGVLTLYADRLPPRLIVAQRLVPAAVPCAPPCVEVRRPFWGKVLDATLRPDVVPPAVVYADLLATGDARCIETAQLVYETHLARLLPAA
jgi:hypothetical protein